MAIKKYTVREGFVVALVTVNKTDGSTYERIIQAGEEIQLDDDQAALHLHKLEFSTQKDRDAALAAEKEAATAKAAGGNPVDMVSMLAAALTQALVASGNAPAAPSTPAA